MSETIKTFANNTSVEFDNGRIDRWCVYHRKSRSLRIAVTDLQIFSQLDKLATKLNDPLGLYLDFIKIYQLTSAKVNNKILDRITKMSKKYDDSGDKFDYLMTILYLGMIAEENKKKARVKKRIKRLGVHQILIEDRSPSFAANFSRGKIADIIKLECKLRGF